MSAAPAPIPLTVIGGFLGAGKTTLLNNVLAERGGAKYAVLVNDFGDLAIDGDLVAEHGGDTITLANGCICCTLGDDLVATLMRILNGPGRPEHVLVEASGVADPRPVAEVGVLHPALNRDAVILLADAERLRDNAADRYVGDTVRRQLAAADIVVLNKCDLVEADRRAALHVWLSEQAPEAAVIDTEFARAPIELLLGTGLGANNDVTIAPQVPKQALADHGHGEAFRTVEVVTSAPLDEARFREIVEHLPGAVLRGKGIVRFRDQPARQRVFQMVGRRYVITDRERGPETDGAETRLVFLGTPAMADFVDLEERLRKAGAPNA